MKTSRFSQQTATLLCLAIMTFIYPDGRASSISVQGTITENAIWSADTVKVTDTVSVASGYTLTINPGTRIEFQGWYPLMVYGELIASGTENDSIIFTIKDTTGFSNIYATEGSWHGIRIFAPNVNDTSKLEYCIIEYCKARNGGWEDTQGAGILLWINSKLILTNSIIRNNHASNNGGGVRSEDAFLSLVQNRFYNNSSQFWGGGLSIREGNVEILNNHFTNNYSKSGGGGVHISSSEPVFTNNIITNNESIGDGGGINLFNTNLLIINNTICFNKGNLGGGVFAEAQINPGFYNNIIWGNESVEEGQQVFLSEFNPVTDFNNCVIQGEKGGVGLVPGSVYFGEFINVIDTVPGFESPPAGAGENYNGNQAEWPLLPESPCINKGTRAIPEFSFPETDYGNNLRVAHGEIDIGAYEFYQPGLEVCDTIRENTTWTADTVKINCDVVIPDSRILTINSGTLVQFQGPYSITVHGTLLALGTETDSIIFTINDTTGFSDISTSSGGWQGIRFYSFATNDSSKILYSRLEHSKKVIGNGNDEWFGGAIFADKCYRVLIENSVIKNNIARAGGGIYFQGSPIEIRNSIISHNQSTSWEGAGIGLGYSDAKITGCSIVNNNTIWEGGGIAIIRSNPFISNCIISNNLAKNGGGIHSNSDSDPVISDNIIANNISTSSGGGLHLNTAAYLSNNLICNNISPQAGGGLIIYTEGDVTLINNIICNNTAKNFGAMSADAGNLKILNNTISNNYASTLRGGAVLKGSPLLIENSILWGNTSAGDQSQLSIYGSSDSPDILHSNIQGGFESILGLQGDYSGRYENNIDALPGFVRPTDSEGADFDGVSADWSLTAASPSVNSGNPLTEDGHILPTDIYGNPRIHWDIIDMGAAENQSQPAVITDQPQNHTKCTGDPVVFSVEASDYVLYQWQFDLEDIPGATGPSYSIDSVTPDHDGNYQCILSNSYGTVKSNPALLRVKSHPEILLQPDDTWAEFNEPSNLRVFARGTEPGYQWRKNDTLIPGMILDELNILNSGYEDEGYYDCIVSNACGSDTTTPVSLYIAPRICIVTVDPETGNNLVVWEKNSSAPILSYNVYRESEAAGIYDLLSTQSYDELSIYTDSTADPTVQSYLYKITAIDMDGVETDIELCNRHKTVHLIVNPDVQNDVTNLQWDFYHGFEYQTYIIYRSPTGQNFEDVHSLSASNKSWTDRDQDIANHYYRIAVVKPDPCFPTGGTKKKGTGPYYHSLSNMDDNRLKSGQMPPDTITISSNTIPEEYPAGTVVGKLMTADLDSVDSHWYKFVPGEGDDDNFSFSLAGDLLMTSLPFDFETQQEYRVRIRSTDEAGNFCEVPFIVQVLDIDETTGLQVIMEDGLKAFPNPFSHSTTIRFHNPDRESYRMVLTDLSGKVLRVREDVNTGDFLLEREGLENGIYVLELRGKNQFRLKIAIQ